jgi:methyl-accepting chemotaxis protein
MQRSQQLQSRGAAGSGSPWGLRRIAGIGDWRVRTKLIIAMIGLVLIPVLVLSLTAQSTLSRTLTRTQETSLYNDTSATTNEIEAVLQRDLALVEYTAKNPFLARFAAAPPGDRFQYRAVAEQQLQQLQQQDPTFEVAGLIGPDGVFYADATGPNQGSRIGVKVDFRDYFKASMAGKSFISDIQVGLTSNKPSVFFSAPVKDDAGKVISVLNLRIGTDPLQKIIAQRAGVQEAMLIDYDGIILAHSTNNDRFQYHSMFPLSAAEQDDVAQNKRFGNNVQQVDSLNAKGFEAGFDRGPEVARFSYTLDGKQYFASMVPVEGTPWRVVTSVSAGTFAGPLNEQTRNNVLLGLVVLVLAVGAALLLARTLTQPLAELEGAARRIGAGDYEVRVPVRSRDELGAVATAVNTMVDQVTTNARQQQEQNKALQQQIVRLLDEVSAVAEGDLTVEAEVSAGSLGAVADSFNYMIAELRQIIGRVNRATRQVSASTDEILATTGALARAAEQQAARIGDTSTAVEEMAVSIQQVSENAAISARVAREARASAEAGARAVTATVEGMGRIRGQVQETAKKIKRLGDSSQEIGAIVSFIQEVADQTELLALNAAIQAAMAGEYGKGFAVVAEEVRRLAERTGEASKQIGGLVKGIQAETTEAVVAMEDGTREVIGGSQLADEAGRSLQAIDQVVGQLNELIEAISAAAEQQARASAGIARAMGEISAVTQRTSAGTEQASGAVAALATLADDLRASVAAFRLEGGPDGYGAFSARDIAFDEDRATANGQEDDYAGIGAGHSLARN